MTKGPHRQRPGVRRCGSAAARPSRDGRARLPASPWRRRLAGFGGLAALIVLAALLPAHPAIAGAAPAGKPAPEPAAAQATTAAGVTVTLLGADAGCLQTAGDGALVSIGSHRLVILPDALSLDGAKTRLSGVRNVVVDASGWGLVVTADGRQVAALDPLAGLREAAAQGNTLALNDLALRYATGDGVPRQPARAEELYRRAAEAGLAVAAGNLGLLLWQAAGTPADRAEAVRWLKVAASAGEATAATRLGLAYEIGSGIQRDLGEARRWYEAAAGAGDPLAMNNLANLLKFADRPDLPRAAALHLAAAENGLAVGAANYGFDLWHGEGVAADRGEALAWFETAAKGGATPALLMLGEAHRDGEGTARDPALAARWLALAAEAGNGEAANFLGTMHLAGDGMPRDPAAARRYFSLAAMRGSAAGRRNLEALAALPSEAGGSTEHRAAR
ncbi:tetratricopeptide repeat protein [Jiella sonneratiae]|uniref:Sel1 repeat family protein n=1 Tax=Jiella sonneratiae TaxID=2816856 RepID=A0ABS3J783_9HYPH|nr:tetratricopeptide repeat protein [Jiella sonneratiae]MBO0905521.1 sel1 repeat family protein [Jiella sonneratiae]